MGEHAHLTKSLFGVQPLGCLTKTEDSLKAELRTEDKLKLELQTQSPNFTANARYYSSMTLRHKMAFQIAAMIAGLLLVSGVSLWGLDALHEDYGLAAGGYQELRQVYEIGSHLATARILLSLEHPDRPGPRAETERAMARFELFIGPGQAIKHDSVTEKSVKSALANAVAELQTPPERQTESDILAADARAITAAIGTIGDLASGIRSDIEAHQRSAGTNIPSRRGPSRS